MLLVDADMTTATPGMRIGGSDFSNRRKSLVDMRRCLRARWTSCWPFRHVSIIKATTIEMRRGNQPPSSSFVVLAAKNTRSTSRSDPFNRNTRTGRCPQCNGPVPPMQGYVGRQNRGDHHVKRD